jgi:hypothetical protein
LLLRSFHGDVDVEAGGDVSGIMRVFVVIEFDCQVGTLQVLSIGGD